MDAELTSTFNDAAQGGGGMEESIQGPDPSGPDFGAEASTFEPMTQGADTGLTQDFNAYASPMPAPMAEEESAWEAPALNAADALAEMEMLEAGRPFPEPREELRPDAQLVQIVHTEVEMQREMRISALRAYVEYAEEGPDFGLDEEFGDDLELAL